MLDCSVAVDRLTFSMSQIILEIARVRTTIWQKNHSMPMAFTLFKLTMKSDSIGIVVGSKAVASAIFKEAFVGGAGAGICHGALADLIILEAAFKGLAARVLENAGALLFVLDKVSIVDPALSISMDALSVPVAFAPGSRIFGTIWIQHAAQEKAKGC